MRVFVNGEPRELPQGFTVAALVDAAGGAPGGQGVAVAVNAEVIPRSAWHETPLSDGERIEILAAIQGG